MNIANEAPSVVLEVPTNRVVYNWGDGTIGEEMDVGPYQVCLRWDWCGAQPRDGGRYAMLQICRADGGSIFDWRDLQQIKNLVLSEHWEGVELFPAEARLKDPSNARYLWCCRNRLPFGLPGGRVVLGAEEAFAPQRPLPPEPPHAGE